MNIYVAGETKNPKSMVILLHGYGANGQDLISLSRDWASDLPDTIFISPDAPFPCDMMPPGVTGSYQWFSIRDVSPLSFLNGSYDEAARAVMPTLMTFIQEQLDLHHLKPKDLVLCGFSQGTMMSLLAGTRFSEPIGGVLGYAGALLNGHDWGQNPPQKPPVCLVHGMADPVVPISAYYHAAKMLQDYGFPFEGHTIPGLMHGIDQTAIAYGRQFLVRVLKSDVIKL